MPKNDLKNSCYKFQQQKLQQSVIFTDFDTNFNRAILQSQ